ncbi:MAG TPA: hypothetical protein VGC89_08740 [Pyrinomonadaceae bacterium]|jgi:hypothetical protein
MSREEAFNTARRLVQEAVDVANRAGIDTASVLAPHCSDAVAVAATEAGGDGQDAQNLMWHNVPVIIDNDTVDLFEMPEADDDAQQQPSFRVTETTANLVRADFERYRSSLERMIEDWQEEKARVLSEQKNRQK